MGVYSVDNVDLHWTDPVANVIQHMPLVGGAVSTDVANSNTPGEIVTPTTGPEGGYMFWAEWGDPYGNTFVVKRRNVGGQIITLLTTENASQQFFFAVSNGLVYSEQNGAIVTVPIDGGMPAVKVSASDAGQPVALAVDSRMSIGVHGPGATRGEQHFGSGNLPFEYYQQWYGHGPGATRGDQRFGSGNLHFEYYQ